MGNRDPTPQMGEGLSSTRVCHPSNQGNTHWATQRILGEII